MGALPSLQPYFLTSACQPSQLPEAHPQLSVQRPWTEGFGQQDQPLMPGPRDRRGLQLLFPSSWHRDSKT